MQRLFHFVRLSWVGRKGENEGMKKKNHFELQLEQEEQRTPPLTRQEREIRVVLGFWAVQAAFCLVGLMICGVVSA